MVRPSARPNPNTPKTTPSASPRKPFPATLFLPPHPLTGVGSWAAILRNFSTPKEALEALPIRSLAQARTLALTAIYNDPYHDPELLHALVEYHYKPRLPNPAPNLHPISPIAIRALPAWATLSPLQARQIALSAFSALLEAHPHTFIDWPYHDPSPASRNPLPESVIPGGRGLIPGEPYQPPPVHNNCATLEGRTRRGAGIYRCSLTGHSWRIYPEEIKLNPDQSCPHCHGLSTIKPLPALPPKPKHLHQTYGCSTSTGPAKTTKGHRKYQVRCNVTNETQWLRGSTFQNNPGYCRFCKSVYIARLLEQDKEE